MNSQWKELMSLWHGKKYQIPNKRVIERYKYVKKCAPHFKDMTVLDLGCNAALFALLVIKYAKEYIGVEGEEKYYLQAQKTAKYLGDKVSIIRSEIESLDFSTLNVEGLIVSRILYYVSDEAIARIKQQLLPKCKVVLMINGTRKKKHKCNSWNFWKRDAGTSFLDSFDQQKEMGEEGASYRILGQRCA